MKFTLGELAAAAGADANEAASGTVLSGVAVDSRQVRRGDLFVAIRGERVDGHDFAAGRRGARGAPRCSESAAPRICPPASPRSSSRTRCGPCSCSRPP